MRIGSCSDISLLLVAIFALFCDLRLRIKRAQIALLGVVIYTLDGFIANYRSGVIVRIVAGYAAHTLLVVSGEVGLRAFRATSWSHRFKFRAKR